MRFDPIQIHDDMVFNLTSAPFAMQRTRFNGLQPISQCFMCLKRLVHISRIDHRSAIKYCTYSHNLARWYMQLKLVGEWPCGHCSSSLCPRSHDRVQINHIALSFSVHSVHDPGGVVVRVCWSPPGSLSDLALPDWVSQWLGVCRDCLRCPHGAHGWPLKLELEPSDLHLGPPSTP